MTNSETTPDIASLAQQAGAGDEIACTALIQATEQALRAFVSTRAQSHEAVDEIVQATYVTAFLNIHRYKPTGSLLAWLMGIALNLLRAELRRQRRLAPLPENFPERYVLHETEAALEDGSACLEHDSQRLRACLERLTPRIRSLIEQRYWHNRTLEDLAASFQQPANNLAALLYRARKSLALCLKGKAA